MHFVCVSLSAIPTFIAGSMPNELNQFNKSHLKNVSDKEIKSYEHFIVSYDECELYLYI